MATGFTEPVQSGRITEFAEFAMTCARAFGATITMREEPLDASIPEQFEPDDYYLKSAAKAEGRLAKLQAMSQDEIAAEAKKDYLAAVESAKQRIGKNLITSARYHSMLAKVQAWNPPSPDHLDFKKFMEDQLKESIRWECGEVEMPTEQSPSEWFAARMQSAQRDLEYSRREWADEQARTAQRNDWVAKLRASLKGAKP